MGPFPWSSLGNLYLLVFVDYYTRWEEMFSLHTATAETVSNILTREILTRWGVPVHPLWPRISVCVCHLRGNLCTVDSAAEKESPYHPQTNMTEQINRNIKTIIASYVEDRHKSCDKYLPECSSAGIDWSHPCRAQSWSILKGESKRGVLSSKNMTL